MKRIAFTLSLVCVVALVTYTSVAQPPGGGRGGQGGGRPGGPGGFGPPPNPILEAIDKDDDHQLSAKEIENAVAALRTLDRNKDGRLSEEELRPQFGRRRPDGGGRPDGPPPGGPEGRRRGPEGGGRPDGPPPEGRRRGPEGGGRPDGPPPEGGRNRRGDRGGELNVEAVVARIMTFDDNKDGKLSRDELPERMQGIIKPGDTNKDGAISRDELAKVAASFDFGGDRRSEAGSGPGRPGGEGNRGPGGFGGPPSPEMFLEHAMRFDADKDGKLSKDELQKLAQEIGRRRGGEGGSRGPAGGRPRDGGGGEEGGDRPRRPTRPDSE